MNPFCYEQCRTHGVTQSSESLKSPGRRPHSCLNMHARTRTFTATAGRRVAGTGQGASQHPAWSGAQEVVRLLLGAAV